MQVEWDLLLAMYRHEKVKLEVQLVVVGGTVTAQQVQLLATLSQMLQSQAQQKCWVVQKRLLQDTEDSQDKKHSK